jgi:hypothetical protein
MSDTLVNAIMPVISMGRFLDAAIRGIRAQSMSDLVP